MLKLTFSNPSRGKKIFRKFSEQAEASSSSQGGSQDEASDLADVDPQLSRALTRSSVKPRLLFPAKDKGKQAVDDDEEALTDIEDHVMEKLDDEDPQTPMELVEDVAKTPEAPKFGASSPSTARVTRAGAKAVDESTPMKPPRGKRSPFDGWRRVKGGSDSHCHKRPGDNLAVETAAKRARA